MGQPALSEDRLTVLQNLYPQGFHGYVYIFLFPCNKSCLEVARFCLSQAENYLVILMT